ncbi:MAG: redox-regulated ATPase YchF [Candidatus Nomurabacteria bacterium]|jgi:GTP-binding protein YchF|nr:redox-regulated ATPase YchF [Candidatus Nomurabacteria bacterium]
MSLSIGLIGLPNVGKSTLFNALTDNDILAANYPFATIEPNEGIVPVPDERLNTLAGIYKTDKIVPATVRFVDVAGLVEGAAKGEGLGNKFLANIRECDAIVHVVRAFENDDIIHVTDKIDPKTDIEVINTELMLADIQTLENHIPKVQKEAKASTELRKKLEYLTSLQNELLSGKAPSHIDHKMLDGLQLLTTKPVIYVFNIDENGLTDKGNQSALTSLIEAPSQAVFVCAKLEEELRALSAVEAIELLADYGVVETGLSQLIKAAYSVLGLQSFLTAGKKEIRAWTIKKGATAPQAAGAIHTDFERGFIAAQIVNYDDLVTAGSDTAARAAGKVRTEGKTYIMQPNDVVEFRFNV